ncbi:MAG: MBL fold metallo-hydrolase RNA specificity domain-containing protein [Eubacteriales bacterium]
MKLSFYGAAREVTGSCYLLEACGKKLLIDCGMEQGEDQYLNHPLAVPTSDIDFVMLTHAHIDHSGNLPLLSKNGFKGRIFSTGATQELCKIMLLDSAHIQQFEAEWKNRKSMRSGGESVEPAYTAQDVLDTISRFTAHEYGQRFSVSDGIEARYVDAGHLLGSASIELWVTEDGKSEKLVFSGDIGNLNQPLLHDPSYPDTADYVVMESTYGDRLHGERPDYPTLLAEIIQRTFDRGGNLVIPSFAVGRTQEMLYYMRKIKADKLVKGHADFAVYVDSPLAIEATEVFGESTKGYFDDEAMELVNKGINPISFTGLKVSVTSDESKAINFDNTPKVIISASGMCEAGRIRHHLKHNLWRKDSTVLFVGYQGNGTLGRLLLDGLKQVKLFGEEIEVKADIVRLAGVSGHADKDGLIRWITGMNPKPKRVFVTHGEESVSASFAGLLEGMGYTVSVPFNGDAYDLTRDVQIQKGTAERAASKSSGQGRDPRRSQVFGRLQSAVSRLSALAKTLENGANKDVSRLADQINSLVEKWEK